MRRPWLGAKLQAVTPEIAESLSLKRPVGRARQHGHADAVRPRAAGLRTGDLVTEVDGQPIDDPNAFDYRFATKPLGGQTQVASSAAAARSRSRSRSRRRRKARARRP